MTFGDDAVGLLCDLIAAQGRGFKASALPARSRGALAFLKRIGAVQGGESPSVVMCEACDDNHPARLDYDPAAQRYWHFCPEAGRVDVADESLATLRIEREWPVRWLVEKLPIVPERTKPLVPDSIWHLGDAVVDRTGIAVVFAARASTGRDFGILADAVRTVHADDLGLVVTASAAPTLPLPLPNGFHILDLREIARVENDRLVIHKARLAGWIKGFLKGMGQPAHTQAGRPKMDRLVQEICDRRRRAGLMEPTKRGEARAIQAQISDEFQAQGSLHPVPSLKTIERHMPIRR